MPWSMPSWTSNGPARLARVEHDDDSERRPEQPLVRPQQRRRAAGGCGCAGSVPRPARDDVVDVLGRDAAPADRRASAHHATSWSVVGRSPRPPGRGRRGRRGTARAGRGACRRRRSCRRRRRPRGRPGRPSTGGARRGARSCPASTRCSASSTSASVWTSRAESGSSSTRTRGPADDGPGQREPLALAAGERQALLADAGVEAPRQVVGELGLGHFEGAADVVVGGVGAAEQQVLADRRREQRRVLEGDRARGGAATTSVRSRTSWPSSVMRPVGDVVEAGDERDQRGLAASRWRRRGPASRPARRRGRCRAAPSVAVAVGEAHALEPDAAGARCRARGRRAGRRSSGSVSNTSKMRVGRASPPPRPWRGSRPGSRAATPASA